MRVCQSGKLARHAQCVGCGPLTDCRAGRSPIRPNATHTENRGFLNSFVEVRMRTQSAAHRLVPLLVALSVSLQAQGVPQSNADSRFAFAANRLTLDAAYSRVWMRSTTEGTAYPMHAATGRLSWRLGEPALTEDAPLADKLAIGV